jgi:D-serine deaminase-like pyridoxal phosphate-dependent protein
MNNKTIQFAELDTPAILINLDKLEQNIGEMTELAASAGVTLRPHTKVHQSAEIAKMQIMAGATGIEVGNVAQAKIMCDNGIDDIVIAHPFVGDKKLETLKKLLSEKQCQITVVVDMIEQATLLSIIGRQIGKKISVCLKIDTGINRYGVLPGKPAIKIAKKLCQLSGVKLTGIYAHESGATPTEEGTSKVAFETASAMCDVANLFKKEGIIVNSVSVGASPTFRATCRYLMEGKFPEITEIHPGQCIIGDLLYMNGFGNKRESCALTVLTAVMSSSHIDHAIIDAGYKTLGSESMIGYRETPGFFWNGYPSFGYIEGRADLWVGRLGAETAWVFYKDPQKRLSLNDRLEMIPNNATLVINLHDKVFGVRGDRVEREIIINGRGGGS